jgi:hypothetical protein
LWVIVAWERFLDLEPEKLIVSLALLATMTAVAVFIVSKIRAKTLQREPPASELLSKFREMHSRGGLTDEEYRTIKTTLSEQLQKQIKDNSETG